MTEHLYDVVGIGNAIVDILAYCNDNFLIENNISKGHMKLLDIEQITELYNLIEPVAQISGGSAANTMVGIASLGGHTAYIGKVSDDHFGRIFTHDIRAAGVNYDASSHSNGASTARSIILVTPDGERTMNTYLGISPELGYTDLNSKTIEAGSILYLEGYLFDASSAKNSFYQAAKIARSAGRKVSLTLSDSLCVDRYRGEFLDFVKSDVDILFANESEINALYDVKNFNDAAQKVQRDVHIAALTRGEKGSVIVSKKETIGVPSSYVKKVINTTGAGDLYAAGFLHGFINNFDLGLCARIGSLAASKIISNIGARAKAELLSSIINELSL